MPTAALEEVDLFDGLDETDLVAVAAVMRFRSFDAGEVICREGESGDSMYLVVGGLVQLLVSMEQKPEVRTRSIFEEGRLVGKLRAGEVFGTGSLLTGEPRSATARAALDSDVLELGRNDFTTLISRFPRMLQNLTRILTRRLAEVTSRQVEPQRGEAVALVAGDSARPEVLPALAAAEAASPGRVAHLDARESAAAALERLDALVREAATVVMVAGLNQEELPQLLTEVDRAVALVGSSEEAGCLAEAIARHGVPGQVVEVVLAQGVEPLALGAQLGDSIRVARRRRGEGGEEAAWLGRHLTRTKLGLALGAGGAKGYAHVGVLQVLERAGYTIDCVSGSSIGAVVGTWIALGLDANAIEAEMRATFTPEAVAETLKVSLSGQSGGLEAMLELLRELTGGRTFDDCLIPLAIMTADLTDRRPAPVREGSLFEALAAATALAGMFPPHERDGHRLVDGLAIDPVPTAAVIEDGADVTVAVNVIPREELPAWPGQPPPESEEPRRRRPGMLDTLLEVMDLAQLDTSEQGTALADIPITPRFGPGSWREFDLADLFLAAGREAAEEQMEALAELARPRSAPVTS